MNARGLTELIILNIGLQAGIIGPALFSMLVLMAIVTTLMASPLFEAGLRPQPRAQRRVAPLKVVDRQINGRHLCGARTRLNAVDFAPSSIACAPSAPRCRTHAVDRGAQFRQTSPQPARSFS